MRGSSHRRTDQLRIAADLAFIEVTLLRSGRRHLGAVAW
jgi:hypothetical protein